MSQITAIGEILFDIYPQSKNLGGAPFNFIYHIIKLSGSGNFISAVGKDDLGAEILEFMDENEIDTKYVQLDEQHPTGIADANLDEKKVPHWKIETRTSYDFINTTPVLQELIDSKTDCLYFGTLARRSDVSRQTIQSFFNKNNIKYFCDLNIRQNFYSKEIIDNSLKAADVLKLNIDELKLINDIELNQPFDIINLSKFISGNYNIELICITLGDKGSYLIRGDDVDHQKLQSENVVDTVGAGDAFASVLCLGYLKGWEISKTNKLASEFAAEIVKIEGALPKSNLFYENFKSRIQ